MKVKIMHDLLQLFLVVLFMFPSVSFSPLSPFRPPVPVPHGRVNDSPHRTTGFVQLCGGPPCVGG